MRKKVLFLCTGNSARSQMAEVLLRHQASDHFEVFSAGTSPDVVDIRTLQALKDFGLATTGLQAKPASNFEDETFNFVITLCDKATQECKSFPNASEIIAWNFEDPKNRPGNRPFEATLKEINERIKMFVLVQTK